MGKETSSLLQRLKENSPKKVLKWPGSEESITLSLITQQKLSTASLRASDIFKEISIGYHNMDDFKEEKLIQALHMCVNDSENKSFCTIQEFKKLVTPEILEWLDNEHCILEDEYSPNIDKMSDSEFDKLIEDLKKKPEETLLDLSSIYILRKACLFLVSPPVSLPTVN